MLQITRVLLRLICLTTSRLLFHRYIALHRLSVHRYIALHRLLVHRYIALHLPSVTSLHLDNRGNKPESHQHENGARLLHCMMSPIYAT